jgi:hypothetical protein
MTNSLKRKRNTVKGDELGIEKMPGTWPQIPGTPGLMFHRFGLNLFEFGALPLVRASDVTKGQEAADWVNGNGTV